MALGPELDWAMGQFPYAFVCQSLDFSCDVVPGLVQGQHSLGKYLLGLMRFGLKSFLVLLEESHNNMLTSHLDLGQRLQEMPLGPELDCFDFAIKTGSRNLNRKCNSGGNRETVSLKNASTSTTTE